MDSTEYLPPLRKTFPKKCDAEIELMLSENCQLRHRTGLSAYEHRKRGFDLLFPHRIWHPWREERFHSLQECIDNRIHELGWMGSASSGKSHDAADVAVGLWLTRPELTTIYVTSPYDDATEKGIWSVIVEQFEEAKMFNPGLPGEVRKSDSSIVLGSKHPRSFIRKVSVDEVGKMQGKKSIDPNGGFIIILADELAAFRDFAAANFIKVMANLRANRNLLVIAAANFSSTSDAFGTMTEPNEEDIPGGWNGFDPDRHTRWRTKRGGLALRFDGMKSPNILAGHDIYPWLTSCSFVAWHLAQPGGLKSPDAMQMVRSAPMIGVDEFTVTNSDRIRAGGAYDKYEWTEDEVKKGAFLDPGFGGDACVLQKFRTGTQKLASGDTRRILALWGPPYEIPIRIGLLGSDGKPIPVEHQIADAARDHCRSQGIPDENVGYDGSMKSGIVQAITVRWSPKVQPMDSGGPPTDRPVSLSAGADGKVKSWKEDVDRFVTELWFATASLIDSYQIRGLELSPKAVAQLTTRRWERSGKKKRLETKKEYRENLRAQGKSPESPNEADCVVGCVEMARRMGLNLDGLSANGGAVSMILQWIKDRDRDKQMREFRSMVSGEETLQPGKLHGISRMAGTATGRLHRR